jgi:hypothetical protein
MFKPDFSDLQKNGYRIKQFRLIRSKRSPEYITTKEKYELLGDIIGERNHVINYLIEENEIDFTIYYFSLRVMFLFIIVAFLSLVLLRSGLAVTIVSGLLSLILYIVFRRYKEIFILGNFGIQLSEDFYNSKIIGCHNH